MKNRTKQNCCNMHQNTVSKRISALLQQSFSIFFDSIFDLVF